MDNGSLELRGVRLPRFHLCSRFARVDAKGRYVKVPDAHPKVAYLTMMQVRRRAGRQAGRQAGRHVSFHVVYVSIHPCLVSFKLNTYIHTYVPYYQNTQVRALIVVVASRDLSKAATIACRYSAVRRQGFDETGACFLKRTRVFFRLARDRRVRVSE